MEALVESIWELIPFFDDISFDFVPRPCNKEANLIARNARIKMINETWIKQYPSWLCNRVRCPCGVIIMSLFQKKKN